MFKNLKEILKHAKQNKYAIPHFNCNNPDWIRACLRIAQKNRSPVIIAGVAAQIRWIAGGYKTFLDLLSNLIKEEKVDVPVIPHLDHGKYEECVEALENNFPSVMFDGSSLPFEENFEKTKKLVEMAKNKNASLEAEVGTIGGTEAGVSKKGVLADINECKKISDLGIDSLAAGIGNIHGEYPKDWKTLKFSRIEEIQEITKGIPLVLHGGSGIPSDQIKKAISLGISKINVHNELLLAFIKGIENSVRDGSFSEKKKPSKLFKPGYLEMEKVIEEKIKLFGSKNKY